MAIICVKINIPEFETIVQDYHNKNGRTNNSLYIFFISFSHFVQNYCFNPKNLPPSPPSLPVFGHLHLLETLDFRFYHRLSQKHGPVFSLRLGSQLFVVVSYSVLAEECFTKNDIILANRPNRLNSIITVRKDEVQRLLVRLSRDSRRGFAKVELKSMLNDLTFNNIMRMVAGKRYYGAKYEVKKIGKKLDGLLQKLVDEHRRMKQENNNNGSVIDYLLNLQQFDPHYYTDEIIKGLMLVILVGTDTTPTSNLLSHPKVLKKAQAEIDTEIGQENLIDEPNVLKLKVPPLLIPLVPSSDCTIGRYDVSCCTIVWVNWERVDGKDIDMTEGTGGTMPKAHPLDPLLINS
uniref:Cytochrome P450 n=1 Tax=Gossypium raimondii TaxID=29730 RepID=A0A0D2QMQ7_GOSRA|nr:hypothetical protein B456_001G089000 [Gossypium raimondii]